MQTDSPPYGRISWIWPFYFSHRVRTWLDRSLHRVQGLIDGWTKLTGVAIAVGLVPVLLALLIGIPVDRPATTLLLTPLFASLVRQDAVVRGLALLSLVFVAHSAVMIAMSATDPARVAALFPAGDAYWQESRDWIQTGVSQEYQLGYWLPAHIMQFAGGALFTFTSLGAILHWEGLYQVDLMNVYVGNLLSRSSNGWVAVGVGWHPWSLMRGIGFLFVGYEACSLSLQRMLGQTLSPTRKRVARWATGVSCLTLDGIIKLTCLESVRAILHDNLSVGL